MRVIALLSWYDEPASWLAELAASLGRFGVDHLVAADGAYFLYPQGRAASPVDQQEALLRTSLGAGMGCTLLVPQDRWAGNEIEKRTALFRAGEIVSEPNVDWYFPVDGDMVLTEAYGWKDQLAELDEHVAQIMLWERDNGSGESQCAAPQLYRAIPGLHVETNHFTYRTGDGRYLRGGTLVDVEPAAMLLNVKVEHRQRQRPNVRKQGQQGYYARRASARAERME